MTTAFPWADFLINVGALAIIPGLGALVGNFLAVEAIRDDTKRRRRITSASGSYSLLESRRQHCSNTV